MTLYINTASSDEMVISLLQDRTSTGRKTDAKFIARKKIIAPRRQAEKLVPAIDRLLKAKKVKLSALKKIIVANRGGSFTSLRIGVITANALAYALKIPVIAEQEMKEKMKKNSPKSHKAPKKFSRYSIVEPIYNSEPNIGISKKTIF